MRRVGALGASETATLVRTRELSARSVIDACLEAIAAADGDLNAFVTLDEDGARRAADAIDATIRAGHEPGPLAGVPVGIKDLLFTAGLRTTFGSAHYRNFVPDQDDIAVERLRAAGAVVIGKTNTSEFGYGPTPRNVLFPPTRNPWNPVLSPTGSSAGSAAAVAGGLVPLALGSDGGGSIRVPAAMTGLVGFKPSFGRIPVYPGCRDDRLPGVSGWESLEHIGPMARTVADVALAYAVMAGPDARDRHSLPSSPQGAMDTASWRIAYSPDLGFAAVDDDVAAVCARAVEDLAHALGATLSCAAPEIGDLQPSFEALVALDTDMDGLRRMRETTGVPFGPALSRLLEREWSAADFGAAQLARKRTANAMAAFMSDFDLLVTPATATAAFPLELDAPATLGGRPAPPSAFAPFSTFSNLTGQPAISLPAGLTPDGRPVGLQVVGRHLADAEVLHAASLFERTRPFPQRLDKDGRSGLGPIRV
ncbi:MAG: amidase [Alsobacter sp.]